MFRFGDSNVDFLPQGDAQEWITSGLQDARRRLGQAARAPSILTDPPVQKPDDLDSLFDFLCAVQEQVGQADVEFALVELEPGKPPVPPGFEALGEPKGQMLHTFHRAGEYAMVLTPTLFRLPELVLASAARELGRLGLHRAGGHAPAVAESDYEADAELAATVLGMGVWVANGAYVFENACCGGGCGIDLRSVRCGLSMPEACFALAMDAQTRGISRRIVSKSLSATQKAAFKASWKHVERHPAALPAPSPAALES